MIGMFALNVATGVREFVWVRERPGPGELFMSDGRQYRADGSIEPVDPIQRGTDADFSRGPITMWSEPLQGHAPTQAPHYDKKGFAVFTSNREIREYEARSRDTASPVEWTR